MPLALNGTKTDCQLNRLKRLICYAFGLKWNKNRLSAEPAEKANLVLYNLN